MHYLCAFKVLELDINITKYKLPDQIQGIIKRNMEFKSALVAQW